MNVSRLKQFSIKNSLNKILAAINSINSSTYDKTSVWTSYSGEEWYSTIYGEMFLKGINNYFKKLYTINSNSKTKISNIYSTVQSYDLSYSRSISENIDTLKSYKMNLETISDNIG